MLVLGGGGREQRKRARERERERERHGRLCKVGPSWQCLSRRPSKP